MRWLTFPLLVWFALLFQATWAEPLAVRGARLDVVLLLAVWFGLNADRREAGFCGFGLGLAQDVLSVGPVGPHALAYLGLCLLLANKRKHLAPDQPAAQMALAFGVVLIAHLAEPLILKIAGGGTSPRFGSAVGDALLAGLVAPLLFGLLCNCKTGWTAKPAR